MRPTVIKHNEAVAHDSGARCAAFGPQSGLVLATGGDDCTVNLWRVGRPNVLMVSVMRRGHTV